jgi:hypothetical protein
MSTTPADLENSLGRYPNLNTRQTFPRAFTTFFAWAKRHHQRSGGLARRSRAQW